VEGTVRDGNEAPVVNAQVVLEMKDEISGPTRVSIPSGPDGRYSFGDVALGDVRVWATHGAIAGSANGALASDGQQITLDISLSPTATVSGVLLRADAVSPVPGTEIEIRYDAPSGVLGFAIA